MQMQRFHNQDDDGDEFRLNGITASYKNHVRLTEVWDCFA